MKRSIIAAITALSLLGASTAMATTCIVTGNGDVKCGELL